MILGTLFMRDNQGLIEKVAILEAQVEELKADAIVNDEALRAIIKAVVNLQRAGMIETLNESLGIK